MFPGVATVRENLANDAASFRCRTYLQLRRMVAVLMPDLFTPRGIVTDSDSKGPHCEVWKDC